LDSVFLIRSSEAVAHALRIGIRLFDTAKRYGNEKELGEILRQSRVPREELFITSKVWPGDVSDVEGACRSSCRRLGVEYLDLYLVHWPDSGKDARLKTWRDMERLVDLGLARSIGVSNFQEQHIKDLVSKCRIIPQVNQFEFNPLQHPKGLLEICQREGIQVEGYCPLGKGGLIRQREVVSIAQELGSSPATVLLAWSLAKGAVTIPMSTNLTHLEENTRCLDLTLPSSVISRLDRMHTNLRCTWDPSGVP